jgi:hypothetical protein
MSDLFDTSATHDAVLSTCGFYRYQLRRTWSTARPPAVFIMLNPSTADASQDDPTIRRCIGFARAWGYGGIVVVNLFAWRATDPSQLLLAPGAVGPDNDYYIRQALEQAGIVVAAWGSHSFATSRIPAVHQLVLESGNRMLCLGTTKEGHPRHPLYVPAATPATTYRPFVS